MRQDKVLPKALGCVIIGCSQGGLPLSWRKCLALFRCCRFRRTAVSPRWQDAASGKGIRMAPTTNMPKGRCRSHTLRQ